jgi:hypothetical protein
MDYSLELLLHSTIIGYDSFIKFIFFLIAYNHSQIDQLNSVHFVQFRQEKYTSHKSDRLMTLYFLLLLTIGIDIGIIGHTEGKWSGVFDV